MATGKSPHKAPHNVIVVRNAQASLRTRREHKAMSHELLTVIGGKTKCTGCGKKKEVDLKQGVWKAHEIVPGKRCIPLMDGVFFLHENMNTTAALAEQRLRVYEVTVGRDHRARCWLCHMMVEVTGAKKFVPHKNKYGEPCNPAYKNRKFVGNLKYSIVEEKPGRRAVRDKHREGGFRSRSQRRHEEDIIMRDENYQPRLTDFDVEESGDSRKAYLGGLPFQGKRR